MKQLAIILSITILFQSLNFDLGDLNKIPTLLEHLNCHIKDGDTIADFIAIHYSGGVNTPKTEHEKHQELPFQHQHSDTHSHVVFILSTNSFAVDYKELILENKKFEYKEPSTDLFTNKFFQPPQV